MSAPFDQFAERIVRNQEYQKIVDAIVAAGGSVQALNAALAKHRYVIGEQLSEPDKFLARQAERWTE